MDTNIQSPQEPKLLFMILWDNAAHCVSVSADGTLWDLKEKINELVSLDASNQELVHEGIRLSGDARPISSFGITGRIAVYRKIQVNVKHGSAVVPMTAHSGMTVRELKRKVLNALGLVYSDNYFLKRGDRVLHNNWTLEAANVDNDSAMKLIREI